MIDWLVPLDTKNFSPFSFWDHGYKSLKSFSYQVSSVLSASFKREREREREREIETYTKALMSARPSIKL